MALLRLACNALIIRTFVPAARPQTSELAPVVPLGDLSLP